MTEPILTVIIPTFNEERNIVSAINSVKKHIKTPHLIIVWDTHSTDRTVEMAKQAGAQVINHPNIKIVEEIRQKSIEAAKTPWLFLLDADEQVSPELGRKIDLTISQNKADVVKIPRLNYFFGQPLKYAGWWPDYQIRLFKKNSLIWPNKIHSQPIVQSKARVINLDFGSYLKHKNYRSISSFINKMNRYTSLQAKEISKKQTVSSADLIIKPFNEFLSRYFYHQGYKGRLLGFSMSLLMAFYIFTTYLKAYRLQKHSWQNPSPLENSKLRHQLIKDYLYWQGKDRTQNIFSKISRRIKLLLLT